VLAPGEARVTFLQKGLHALVVIRRFVRQGLERGRNLQDVLQSLLLSFPQQLSVSVAIRPVISRFTNGSLIRFTPESADVPTGSCRRYS